MFVHMFFSYIRSSKDNQVTNSSYFYTSHISTFSWWLCSGLASCWPPTPMSRQVFSRWIGEKMSRVELGLDVTDRLFINAEGEVCSWSFAFLRQNYIIPLTQIEANKRDVFYFSPALVLLSCSTDHFLSSPLPLSAFRSLSSVSLSALSDHSVSWISISMEYKRKQVSKLILKRR